MHASPLEQAVIRTLAWFSLFDYPMSTFEVWKWMIEPERRYNLSEVNRVLDESAWLISKLQRQNGLIALKGKTPISFQIEERQVRFLDAVRKFHRLRYAAHYFRLVPGVKAVAAANTLGWWFTTRESDIDLFIITKPRTIWSTRFLLVAPFAMLGLRPHTGKLDPFCFSFFVTQEKLPLEEIALERDYYLAFWCKTLVPIFDRHKSFEDFYRANRWVETMLPQSHERHEHLAHTPASVPPLPISLSLFESVTRSVQQKQFPDSLTHVANRDTRVIINDTMLKFHTNDRRAQLRDAFEVVLEKHL